MDLLGKAYYISVRSQDVPKLSPGFTTALSVAIDPPLVAELGMQFSVKVHSLYIPYSFYNINSNNNKFDFDYVEGAFTNSFTITIDPGNWNLTNLLADLQTQVRSQCNNNVGITFSLNRSIGKVQFTIASSPACTLTVKMATGVNANRQSRQILGVTSDLVVNSGNTVNGDNVASVLTVPRLCVRSDILTTNSYDTAIATASNQLAEITVDVPLFSLLSFVPSNSREIDVFPNSIGLIQLSITDPDYFLIDLNGLDWSIVLEFNQHPRNRINPLEVDESRQNFVEGQLADINIDELPPLKRQRTDTDVMDMTDANRRNQTIQNMNSSDQTAQEVEKEAKKRSDIKAQKKKEKTDERIDEVLNKISA